MIPALQTADADPEGDRKGLKSLCVWAEQFCPWVTPDGADGFWLDITGSAHLFGGEEALLQHLSGALEGFGLRHRVAIAETPGGAYALARYGEGDLIVPHGSLMERLAPLPVDALRLDLETGLMLRRLGLKTIGQIMTVPRDSLARRFETDILSAAVLRRLDQIRGLRDEPLSPMRPRMRYQIIRSFAEPLVHEEALLEQMADALEDLCRLLQQKGRGARHLAGLLFRSEGGVVTIVIRTARASDETEHFLRLLKDRTDGLDAGFGFDALTLEAVETELLHREQTSLPDMAAGARIQDDRAVMRVVDLFSNRLGADAVSVLALNQSHVPERAHAVSPGLDGFAAPAIDLPAGADRPIRLLSRPEVVDVIADLPDGPPARFQWRKRAFRVVKASGPERIEPEWWRSTDKENPRVRDYYKVEDEAGQRYWIFRAGTYQSEGRRPVWYMHGFFL